MSSFQDFKLPAPILKALETMGYEIPTPIQVQAIPAALSRRDIVACAQTGTGKTAAFCIPMLVRLPHAPGKTALILAPTRELAQQIEGVWKDLTRFTPQMEAALLIGGKSMDPQVRALRRNPRVLVATPGRLIDHLQRGSV